MALTYRPSGSSTTFRLGGGGSSHPSSSGGHGHGVLGIVKNLAVELIGRKPNLIKCAQLSAAIEIIVGPLRKPEPQAVLDHMMMAKMVGEPQAFGQETSAHLGRRLTNLAIEPLRPLDHHDAKFRDFAPKQ